MEHRTIAVLSDLHVPFHDERAVELSLQIIEDVGVDEIILNGDIADMFGVNSHGKNPNIKENLLDEIDSVVYFLLTLKERFNCQLTYISGNHEHRLERYLQNQAPELYGMLSIKDLFFLDDYGYNYIPYTNDQAYEICEGLICRHEPIAGGMHFAHGTLVKGGESFIVGHTHRVQHTNLHLLSGKKLSCFGVGWLGNKRLPCFGYVKNHHNWDLAFGLVHIIDKKFFVDTVEIQEQCGTYSAVCNGNFYEL